MAKGHLLITPPTRSKDKDEEEFQSRQSCFRQLDISDGAILLSGIQLAIMVGYLLHLVTGFDAPYYPTVKFRVNIALIVVPIMIAVVMLFVFGIVGKRLWMIVPNVLAQLAFVAIFIAAAVHLGQAVSNFPIPDHDAPEYKVAQTRLYGLKVYMALAIVALILSILSVVVVVLCFVRVYKTRNNTPLKKEENGNGY